jgi:hypothetical protein
MDFFCGDQWKAIRQIKSHLPPKNAVCTGSSTVFLLGAVMQDVL